MLLGSSDASEVHADLGPLKQHLTNATTNLDVRLDSDVKFDAWFKSAVKSNSFFNYYNWPK